MLNCNLTIENAAREITELLKRHYLRVEKPIVVGFDRDGDVNWDYDIEGMRTSVVIPFMTTEFDFSLDVEGDPADPDYWTSENFDSISDSIILGLRDLQMKNDIVFI